MNIDLEQLKRDLRSAHQIIIKALPYPHRTTEGQACLDAIDTIVRLQAERSEAERALASDGNTGRNLVELIANQAERIRQLEINDLLRRSDEERIRVQLENLECIKIDIGPDLETSEKVMYAIKRLAAFEQTETVRRTNVTRLDSAARYSAARAGYDSSSGIDDAIDTP